MRSPSLGFVTGFRYDARTIFSALRLEERVFFGWSVRQELYRHLTVQIENNISEVAALQLFHKRLIRRKKKGSARIVSIVARRMRDGVSLSAALRAFVPADEALVIMGGETAGQVGQSFALILDAKERLSGVRKTMVSAFVTPFVYLCAIYGLLWFVGSYVLPTVDKIVPAGQITGLGTMVVAMGAAATSLWAIVPGVALLAGVAWMIWAFPRWTGSLRVKFEQWFPFNFYRDIQGYVWILTFSSMLKAGVPDTQILGDQAALASPWLQERLVGVKQKMGNGASFANALIATGKGFPNPDLIDDIQSMSGFLDFPDRMRKRALQWSDELQWTTMARVKAVGFIFDMVMYAIMLIVLGGINSMTSQIGSVPTFH